MRQADTIDLVAIERAIRLTRARSAGEQWRRPVLKFGATVAFLLLVPILAGGYDAASWDVRTWRLWLRVGIAVVAGLLLAEVDRRSRAWLHVGSVEMAVGRVAEQWRDLTRPGWYWKALGLAGAGLGLFGVVMGTFFAWLLPPEELARGSRVMTVLGFATLAVLWSIPMVFLGRAALLWRWRRWMRRAVGKSA